MSGKYTTPPPGESQPPLKNDHVEKDWVMAIAGPFCVLLMVLFAASIIMLAIDSLQILAKTREFLMSFNQAPEYPQITIIATIVLSVWLMVTKHKQFRHLAITLLGVIVTIRLINFSINVRQEFWNRHWEIIQLLALALLGLMVSILSVKMTGRFWRIMLVVGIIITAMGLVGSLWWLQTHIKP